MDDLAGNKEALEGATAARSNDGSSRSKVDGHGKNQAEQTLKFQVKGCVKVKQLPFLDVPKKHP